MIVCDQLCVKQGSFTLGPLDLSLSDKTYHCLMGSTGCGKTTLIEAICGLRPIASGKLFINDVEVSQLDPARRGIGYVPQDGALFPALNVYDQIAYGLRIRKMDKGEIDRRVTTLATELGITHLLTAPIPGLSGGERQRVALARALAIEPALLLLDEPLSALDEDRRDEMIQLLQRVHKEHQMAVLHITHARSEAEALADRIIRLHSGQIASDASQSHNS